VYAAADRATLRPRSDLAERAEELVSALDRGAPLPAATELLHNDLQRAAVGLCPEIAPALEQARAAGAEQVLVSGSGPTVLGLFARAGGSPSDGPALAEHAAAALSGRVPRALAATPVGADFALPVAM
jgi:4-diphosphocytidyl-2-C-methyl-D-erythritol kinase